MVIMFSVSSLFECLQFNVYRTFIKTKSNAQTINEFPFLKEFKAQFLEAFLSNLGNLSIDGTRMLCYTQGYSNSRLSVGMPKTMQVRKPPKGCVTCIKKWRFFNTRLINNLKEKITNRSDLSQFKMYPQGFSPFKSDDTLEPNTEESPESYLSHYFSLTPEEVGSSKGQSESESRLNAEDNEHMNMEEPCLNDYNCKCENCQNKYGSLPILLQGIEQKSLSHKTEPQPSTSSQKVPKKVLTCEYCKKTFTHKGDFNKHLRKHTREKPFSCTVCNRKFAHTSNLQRHQRLHSGFKPFVCDLCNKTFSRKDKLDCHRRSRICSGTSSSTVPE